MCANRGENKMKALITGSEGFIGRNLSRELKDNGYDVVCCDIVPGADSQALDIMDKQAVKDIHKHKQPGCDNKPCRSGGDRAFVERSAKSSRA